MLKIYNQLNKKIEDFCPQNQDNVKIYTCGPTVYNYAHIGNLASYVYWDVLVRDLMLNGYTVNRVLNLTDVGHLASDADEGEDKLEKGAKREGKTVWEIAKKYIDAFLNDFHALNLIEPNVIARATDYIEQDKQLVDLLTNNGFTYETSDGIYFNTAKFPTYANFAKLDLSNLKAGARIEFNNEKLNSSDFAVWKYIKKNEDHAMQWQYRNRAGYPGWHLECATIIHEELGGTIDIHAGGIDHIPVHHTNEIAEYECGYNQKLANYWVHNNFLTIDGQKISKSLGNIYTLRDLRKREFSPLDYKMWVLQGHYRSERNFSFDDLIAARSRRLNWRNRIALCYQNREKKSNSKENRQKTNSFSQKTALSILNNNLNSSEVLAYIDNTELELKDWRYIDQLLGLNLVKSTPDISEDTQRRIFEREMARKNKDYAISDKIREELAKQNITVLDSPSGPIWQYLK